jgi:hypothetical protein
MSIRWISDVHSKVVKISATGKQRAVVAGQGRRQA